MSASAFVTRGTSKPHGSSGGGGGATPNSLLEFTIILVRDQGKRPGAVSVLQLAASGRSAHGLLKWGDRTPMFECKRGGAIKNQESVLELFEAQGQPIGFVYLQTTGQLPPARLEIPMWVYQQGLLEEVLNIIRAEVVVGNGYPYAIEAADATAVINTTPASGGTPQIFRAPRAIPRNSGGLPRACAR